MVQAAVEERPAAVEGLNYSEIARRVGVSPAHISYILDGKRCPSLGVAVKLAGELGWTVEKLNRYLNKKKVASD